MKITKEKYKKWIALGILFLVGLLAVFKVFLFFAEVVIWVLIGVGAFYFFDKLRRGK